MYQVSRTTLATYLSEMRASSKLLQDRVEQTLDSGMITDDLRLDNVGGLSIIGGDGQTVSWNMSAPLYVFDNEVSVFMGFLYGKTSHFPVIYIDHLVAVFH